MNTAGKIFAMMVWLGALAVAGSVVLSLTAARVGEHKSSTYGNAYTQFQNSWGGEIAILPPVFGFCGHILFQNITKIPRNMRT